MNTKHTLALTVALALGIGLAVAADTFAGPWGPGHGGPYQGGNVTAPYGEHQPMGWQRHGMMGRHMAAGQFYGPGNNSATPGVPNGTGPRAQLGNCPLASQQNQEPAG